MQIRPVLCVSFVEDEWKLSVDAFCNIDDRPPKKRACNSEICQPQWFTSDWSQVCIIQYVF